MKLVLSASGADAFMRSGLMAGQPIRQKLHAIYFETPDQALLRAGISLRIRRSGRKRIQTIKVGGPQTGGLFEREELERPVADDHPVLDGTVPPLLGEVAGNIAPAFEVRVERLTWLVDEEAASIELVLDRGAVMAAGRQSQVCELELEVKRGAPHAVFALARRIAQAVPVRPGVVTKAERGYDLLGPARRAVKADKMRIDEDISSAQAFAHIAGSRLRQYLLNETLLLAGPETEALHQARVALRRLRSAIAIFKPLLDSGMMAHAQSELRWLAAVLGDARDLDVLLARARPGALRDHLQGMRDKAYAAVGAALGSERARMLLLDLAEWVAVGTWLERAGGKDVQDLPARDFAEKALRKLRKRVKERGAYLAKLSDDERHAVRKAAKRLRYGVEFFGALFSGEKREQRYRKFGASLEGLQDDLGELNDLVSAPHVLARVGLEQEEGAGDLLSHGKKSRIIDASQEALDDLMDRKDFWS